MRTGGAITGINNRTKTHIARAYRRNGIPPRSRLELTRGDVVVLYIGNLGKAAAAHDVFLKWCYLCDISLSPYLLFFDEMIHVDAQDFGTSLDRDPADNGKAFGITPDTVIKLRTTNRSPSQWDVSASLAPFVTWDILLFDVINHKEQNRI